MASYFILGLIEIFMLCFNEIKLKGDGALEAALARGFKGTVHIFLSSQGPELEVTSTSLDLVK